MGLQPSRPPQSNSITKLEDNTINFHAILNGIQTLTTIMIKNIPMRFSQHDLLQMIVERHGNTFDYFYLPMDLRVSSPPQSLTAVPAPDALQPRLRLHQLY